MQIEFFPLAAIRQVVPREANCAGDQIDVLELRSAHERQRIRLAGRIEKDFNPRLTVRPCKIRLGEKRSGEIRLGIAVDQQHALPALVKRACDLKRRGRFSDASLEIQDRDDGGRTRCDVLHASRVPRAIVVAQAH